MAGGYFAKQPELLRRTPSMKVVLILVAVAQRMSIGLGRRRVVVTATLEATERRQRALLGAKLHNWPVLTEWL